MKLYIWSALKSTKLNWIGQVGMTALRQLAMCNKLTHFRDYKKDWDNTCSDLIVLLVNPE